MLAKVKSGAVIGVDGMLVDVEVDLARGLPNFTTVGLPEGAVRESKERVRAAIKNSGYEFPSRRITINLAPADLKKGGTGYDLPIAVGILAASELLPAAALPTLSECCLIGELSLDGAVRPVPGVLPMTLAARQGGMKTIMAPADNAAEAAMVEGIRLIPVSSLGQAVEILCGNAEPPTFSAPRPTLEAESYEVDFAEIKGQAQAKRAMEIAAAGHHNILLQGPPGAGKTMLARRLPTILPELSFAEALETTRIYSVTGKLPPGRGLLVARPFRDPHHTISDAGLIGGGSCHFYK